MKLSRVYIDTSVVGGCHDDEFSSESNAFFRRVRKGLCVVLLSEVVLRELENAPTRVGIADHHLGNRRSL